VIWPCAGHGLVSAVHVLACTCYGLTMDCAADGLGSPCAALGWSGHGWAVLYLAMLRDGLDMDWA
jgi:hypothetical protein